MIEWVVYVVASVCIVLALDALGLTAMRWGAMLVDLWRWLRRAA